jgi:hypothetical protein
MQRQIPSPAPSGRAYKKRRRQGMYPHRSGIRAILERYDEAESQKSKIAIMREMERLAFDEMRNFLITNERSRFVM